MKSILMIYFENMENIEVKINVTNVIGDVYGVEAEEGQKVYDLIKKAFAENRKVVLSFLNIEILTTAFLNTSIGQLYKDFSEETIKKNLSVENISESGKVILKRVVGTAKLFYKDKDTFLRLQQSIEEILEN
ncbi:MAG: STAS-like domain-containing protein [Prevotellaceae bacterium]|nr:STAS-like domain-containing protein [Prevotellaceae bacterium]